MTEFKTSDFVITAHFVEGEEYHLQLKVGESILATVCEPAGDGGQREFAVWDGCGLDDNNEEERPLKVFYTSHTLDVNRTWRQAVAYAYAYAGIQMGGMTG